MQEIKCYRETILQKKRNIAKIKKNVFSIIIILQRRIMALNLPCRVLKKTLCIQTTNKQLNNTAKHVYTGQKS